jgi:endoglucanase
MWRVALVLTLTLIAWAPASVLRSEELPLVHEITMATPDTIAIEIRDPGFSPGAIVPLAAAVPPGNAWVEEAGDWGLVLGPKRDHLRRSDRHSGDYLDRAAIDRAGEYGMIGDRKVVGVYRKSVPYDSGIMRGGSGDTQLAASFKHYVYLKLDGPLRQGRYAIKWPGRQLPETQFAFDDHKTRALALRVNQNGYAPGDEGKIAYLSFWLPGGPANGAVDFRALGLKTFQILDAANGVAFSGEIAPGRAPGDPEEGTGLGAGLIDYPTNGATIRPARLLARNPIGFEAAGHGFKESQTVRVSGFAGALAKLNGIATIARVGRDQFSLLGLDGTGLTAQSDQIGTIEPIYRANRAGTHVFRLDFSQWRPTALGKYRIFVPGLGVSDAFDVGDGVWLKAAQAAAAGLYHHRSGIALDGRFGYRRPVAFRPGPDFALKQSALPLPFTAEAGTGFLPFETGAAASWTKGPSVDPALWGGYMDAGDWDRRINHLEISYALMDLYEHGTERGRSVALGIPKSREVLDPALYAESDNLPDLLHEVIWNVDFYRRLQLPDGRMRGGIESNGHPVLGEPSYLESLAVFVYAPDHISGFRYAAAAAKLSRILSGLDKPALAKLYADSAISAWNAAEIGFSDPDSYYRDALEIMQKTPGKGLSGWPETKAALQRSAGDYRASAAASLYRLKGNEAHRLIFEKAWVGGMEVSTDRADGAWEYLHLPSGKADGAIQQAIRRAFAHSVDYVVRPQASATYMNLKNGFTPAGWGQGLAPDYNALQLLMRSHMLSGDKRILQAMQFGSAHILGANQVGLSFTTGLGARNVKHPLHEDHRAMGVNAPAGITLYGWSPQSQTSYDWIFGADWSPLSDVATRGGVAYKRVDPGRLTLPFYEFLIEYPGVIIQQEYTINQTIGTTAALWIYLYGAKQESMQ